MSKARTKDPLDRSFALETLQGKAVRGKYFAKVSKGSNVVKLDPDIKKFASAAETSAQ